MSARPRRDDRPMRVITRAGLRLVDGLDPGDRSLVATHHNAIRTYLNTGAPSGLDRFDGVTVGGHELETSTDALDWWGLTGELSYDSIYGEVT